MTSLEAAQNATASALTAVGDPLLAGLTIALSKGRILQQSLPLLARVGIVPVDDPERSRKLIFETNCADIRLVLVRASDAPTYVQYGAADMGIAGKDVLLEHGGAGLYEPLDLGISRCRLMLAGRPGALTPTQRRLRVATKYVDCTRRYFAAQGRQVDIIKLYGSMELAPLTGLADCIVDLVDSGRTLEANGLVALAPIAEISSRLVVNKGSMKMKHAAIKQISEQLAQALAGADE